MVELGAFAREGIETRRGRD